MQNDGGILLERYWNAADGMRVKKTRGSTTDDTFFAHNEEEVTSRSTTAVSYNWLGSLGIAKKRGNTLYHQHGDRLKSTEIASRTNYAYDAERSATGDLQTDRPFKGQKRDATGLMYYNARYYDPTLGTFVSPDSMAPGAGQVKNYNHVLYAPANPLQYTDSVGHWAFDGQGKKPEPIVWLQTSMLFRGMNGDSGWIDL